MLILHGMTQLEACMSCSHYSILFVLPDAVPFSSARFGAGTGPIYLNTVDTSGSV